MSETSLFIFIGLSAVVIAIIIFDVVIIAKKGKDESISAYIIRASKKYPAFFIPGAAIFGFVCGHLFWSMDTFDYEKPEVLTKKCKEYLGE